MSESSSENRAPRRYVLAAACLVALAAAVGLVVSRQNGSPPDAEQPPRGKRPPAAALTRTGAATPTLGLDAETLDRRIEAAVDYMVRSCDSDGRFVYWVHLDPEITPPPAYNVLRHAGAMYSLGMHYDRSPSDEVRDALLRSGEFLYRECVAPLPDRDDVLGVWSPPELVFRDEPPQAKLGGGGLGLVGLLAMERANPGAVSLDDLRKVGRFLLYLQKDDGSFYTKYIPSDGGRWDRWTSLYYPGEAALGLVMLYERDRSPEWLAAAAKAMEFLARIREGNMNVPADHWALIATARILAHADEAPVPIDRDALLRHGKQICERMLRNQLSVSAASPLSGSFTPDGRTSPAATHLEGLLAALEFLPEEDVDFRASVEDAATRGIRFLLRTQVTSGEYAGGVPRAIVDLPGASRRAGEIRIDNVQHAVSAMMGYEQLFLPPEAPAPAPPDGEQSETPDGSPS